MLKPFTIVFLLVTSISAFTQDFSINEIRNEYFYASFGSDRIEGFYDKLMQVEDRTPTVIAYDAASKAVLTRTTWNWFKKLDYLEESRELFIEAVKKEPKNVEIRILRITVEDRIPFYLGLSDHMEDDKNIILKHLDTYDTAKIKPEISKHLHERLSENDVFSEEELNLIKKKLGI